jgi:hypothetical protein
MSAGSKYEYHWADGVKVKTPVPLSAPEYVEALMDWIQALLDNEKIFPSRTDVPFPKHFESVVKQIFKKLFRVYVFLFVCLQFWLVLSSSLPDMPTFITRTFKRLCHLERRRI